MARVRTLQWKCASRVGGVVWWLVWLERIETQNSGRRWRWEGSRGHTMEVFGAMTRTLTAFWTTWDSVGEFWQRKDMIWIHDFLLFFGFFFLTALCLCCSTRASLAVALGFSCPEVCWILVPWPGIEPVSLALEGRFLTHGPPGKTQSEFILMGSVWLQHWEQAEAGQSRGQQASPEAVPVSWVRTDSESWMTHPHNLH